MFNYFFFDESKNENIFRVINANAKYFLTQTTQDKIL